MIASLRSLLLIKEAFEISPAYDRAGADLDRLNAAVVDQLVEKGSGDSEILSGFINGEARP